MGDVVIPEGWALYQHQIYARWMEQGQYHLPVDLNQGNVVARSCGASNGLGDFLTGSEPCNFTMGEASNLK